VLVLSLDPRLAISHMHVGRLYKNLGRYIRFCVPHPQLLTPGWLCRHKIAQTNFQMAVDIEIDGSGENCPLVADTLTRCACVCACLGIHGFLLLAALERQCIPKACSIKRCTLTSASTT
jgi:hypothetical protein